MVEPVHRRVVGEESCPGVPIRADLSAISEAIPRCRTSGVGREGAENRVLYLWRQSRDSKIRKIADAEDESHYPGATTFDIMGWGGANR